MVPPSTLIHQNNITTIKKKLSDFVSTQKNIQKVFCNN